jgi:malate dehydrogenase
MRDWALGSNGEWVTMGVPSDGSYGIPEGIIYGFPCTCANGEYKHRQGPGDRRVLAPYDAKTLAELEEERAGVADLL